MNSLWRHRVLVFPPSFPFLILQVYIICVYYFVEIYIWIWIWKINLMLKSIYLSIYWFLLLNTKVLDWIRHNINSYFWGIFIGIINWKIKLTYLSLSHDSPCNPLNGIYSAVTLPKALIQFAQYKKWIT